MSAKKIVSKADQGKVRVAYTTPAGSHVETATPAEAAASFGTAVRLAVADADASDDRRVILEATALDALAELVDIREQGTMIDDKVWAAAIAASKAERAAR